MRDQVRTGIYDANHIDLAAQRRRQGSRYDRIPLHVHAPRDSPEHDRLAGGVTYTIFGYVSVHLRAWGPRAEYVDSIRRVGRLGPREVDIVINDQERSRDILWFSR